MSTYEKECLAILLAVDRWRSYLQHSVFTIVTDHRNLTHLTEQKLVTSMQQKAFLKLMGLQYKIKYKKGLENTAADALSRQVEEDQHSMSISVPRWMEIIQEGYEKDEATKQLLTQLSVHSDKQGDFQLMQGIIRHNGKIWLGQHEEAKQAVLLALHSSGVGGHSGITATYNRVKTLFSWSRLKNYVQTYVQGCEVCQKAKSEHCKLSGLLQTLPVPLQAWSTVSLDFIEGLPKSGKFDTILAVVDKFTKFAKFIALSHPFTALTVAQAFIQNVYEMFGMPRVIISDQDRMFTSALWQELFRLADVKLNMSSFYHPQTNG